MLLPKVYSDIVNTEAHTLIGGQTGSGKSVFLSGLLTAALARNDIALILIDPKKVELQDFARSTNCLCYASELDESITALDYAISIMQGRYSRMAARGIKKTDEPMLFVVIDELADLLISERSKEVKQKIQKITQLGRAARVLMITATQAPSRKILPAEITLNYPMRVALHCLTAIESRQVLGINGAERLPQYGECLALFPQRGVEHWEVPLIDPSVTRQAIALAV